MQGTEIVISFAVAGGLGLAIGLERQVGKKQGTSGARTFALYGIWGSAAAMAGDRWAGAGFAAMSLGFMALVVLSRAIEPPVEKVHGTTTTAAEVATFVVGILAWEQDWVPAVMLAVATAVVLGMKEYVHDLADRISPDDTRAALQFAVVTGIVLPLVPDENYGPYGAINPREIWMMVVIVSAIGLTGYVGLRVRGAGGVGVTGILGGIVSSTAVTLGFSRQSRAAEALRPALAAGILGACALMYPRVVVEAFATSPGLGSRLLPSLVPLTFVLAGVTWWWLRHPVAGLGDLDVKNPLTLLVAIQFAALYAVIVLIARALVAEASEGSVLLLGLVSGVADVDAITLSAGNLVSEGLDERVGAQVVLLAATSNAMVKAGLVWALGTRRLAWAVGGTLLASAAVTGAAAAVL